MVVDDDFLIRKWFVLLLKQSAGCEAEVLQAENGQQALELLREQPVDLVITDIKMPVMDGIGLIRQLRAQPESPQIVVLNKIDVPEARELAEFVRPEFEEMGFKVFEISTASHEGLKPLIFAMAKLVEEDRAARAAAEKEAARVTVETPVIRPKGFRNKKKQEFVIRREERNLEPLFRVIGEKPERWIQQTDFNNDEAVGYLADRLARLGVEDELFKAGARAGDAVVIGESDNSVIFDWEPTMVGGAELLSSPRGTDARLEEIIRPTRAQKRVEYKERMDAKAAARAELESERVAGVWTESVEYRKKLKEGKVDESIDMLSIEDED
ncbi:MAG: DUF1967 domain-containing protein [Rothia mucilaginosa]|nr:DUF1967 domain-containing protein [Rothia mucilaginosa]